MILWWFGMYCIVCAILSLAAEHAVVAFFRWLGFPLRFALVAALWPMCILLFPSAYENINIEMWEMLIGKHK